MGILDKGLQSHSPIQKNLADVAFSQDFTPLMKTPLLHESGISNHYSPFQAPKNLASHIQGRALFKEETIQPQNLAGLFNSPNPKQTEIMEADTPSFYEKGVRRKEKARMKETQICC